MFTSDVGKTKCIDMYVYDWDEPWAKSSQKTQRSVAKSDWDELKAECMIRGHCLDVKSERCGFVVKGFYIRVMFEALGNVKDQHHVLNEFNLATTKACSGNSRSSFKPFGTKILDRRLLYDLSTKPYRPFIAAYFKNSACASIFSNKIRNIDAGGDLTFIPHETWASPTLQFCARSVLPSNGWVRVDVGSAKRDKNGYFIINTLQIKACDDIPAVRLNPMLFSIDTEAYSSKIGMPNPNIAEDELFQISIVAARLDDSEKSKYVLTLGKTACTSAKDDEGDDFEIIECESESALLSKYAEFVQKFKPVIIIGHNIFTFDLDYMIKRSERFKGCTFLVQGIDGSAKVQDLRWSSKARGDQKFKFLKVSGTVYVDMLPIVESTYRFPNYKLSTISKTILKDDKLDFSVGNIFSAYQQRFTNPQLLTECAKYCLQDSNLVDKLFKRMLLWETLTEMSSTCKVPILSLYTEGQLQRAVAQFYNYCVSNKLVMCTNTVYHQQRQAGEHYCGASVIKPEPGLYTNVISHDFASLYPSIIVAYNLCFSTLVKDGDEYEEDKVHTFEWEDHVACEHDPAWKRIKELEIKIAACGSKVGIAKMRKEKTRLTSDMSSKRRNGKFLCEKRLFRFLKEPKGVMPTIVSSLLDVRKKTKVEMGTLKTRLKKEVDNVSDDEIFLLKGQIGVLDKRQLSQKICANSMYGAMGSMGKLSLLPAAMTVTFVGRSSIKKISEKMAEKGAKPVYGDTDSVYTAHTVDKTSSISVVDQLWERGETLGKEVTKLFPKPMKLEFEGVIFQKILLISKKCYIFQHCEKDGKIEKNLGSKGTIVTRRDNSPWIKRVYDRVVRAIFSGATFDETVDDLNSSLDSLYTRQVALEDFVITKSLSKSYGVNSETGFIEPNIETGHAGGYKLRKCLTEAENLRMTDQQKHDFYLNQLPLQVKVMDRVIKRGDAMLVEGSRIEYVQTVGFSGKEHPMHIEYFKRNSDVFKVDFDYYVRFLVPKVDEIISAVFKRDFVMRDMFNLRCTTRRKLLAQIKVLPRLSFD